MLPPAVSASTQGRLQVGRGSQFEADHQQPRQFAVLLNHLFATRLHPEGRPYTLTEVSKATGLSVPYLSILRKGTIGAVSLHRAATLARFFRVPLDYFSQEGPPVDTMDDLVREALAQPLVREVALRAANVGMAQRHLPDQRLRQGLFLQHDPDATAGPGGGAAGGESRRGATRPGVADAG